jgi:ribulose-phosphate 3-epimerase
MSMASRETLRQKSRGLSVGLYAAPLGALSDAVRLLGGWGGQILHFDVMDGVFVPQFTAGPGFLSTLGQGMVRDVHLMVADPASQVDAFAEAGADIITVHAEAETAKAALAGVRAASQRLGRPILAGLAVMPGTPLESLRPLLDPMPDMLLMLALDPRTGTPPDLEAASARLSALAQMVAPARPLMAIDGGVTEATIATAAQTGPDMIVSGSAIFRAADPEAAFRHLSATWAAASGATGGGPK